MRKYFRRKYRNSAISYSTLTQSYPTLAVLSNLIFFLILMLLLDIRLDYLLPCRYNASGNGKISLEELKTMMEKLKAPQTHLGLKGMIKEVDEDGDGAICFREFLLIFRKAAAGELDLESGLGQLATLTEVDVDEVGVGGAKNFFEAKVIIYYRPIYL